MEANPLWEGFWEFIAGGLEPVEGQEEMAEWIGDLRTNSVFLLACCPLTILLLDP